MFFNRPVPVVEEPSFIPRVNDRVVLEHDGGEKQREPLGIDPIP